MAIAAAVDGMGVALESTRLAERELARGDLVQPLLNQAVDVRYVGHHLVVAPRARSSATMKRFLGWLEKELDVPLT